MHVFTRGFPLWAILASCAAYAAPELFAPLKPAIMYLLGLVMFGMGISLHPRDFIQVLKRPSVLLLGVGLQFLLMPCIAWGLAEVLQLPLMLAAGLILVGTCPGGTASNVICYLAKGNIALSIALTTLSTLFATVATPFLTLLYAGQMIEVPVLQMLRSIVLIVLLPVSAGLILNLCLGHYLRRLQYAFPAISVAAIVLIIAIIVALNSHQFGSLAIPLLAAVALHNGLGLLFGYAIPRLIGLDHQTCKTLSIEVGMQNSGLAVALAIKHFSATAALPGAIFSLWHNLSGSILASCWARK